MEVSKLFSLEGKVAIITGGSRGIGRAIALQFAEAGANVVVASRTLPDLEKVVEEIKGLGGGRALAMSTHIGRTEGRDNLIKRAIDEFGKIDILVSNAATAPYQGDLLDETCTEGLWDAVFNLNLKGAFFLSRAVAKVMKEHGGGNIIIVSSFAGLKSFGGQGIYEISKAGLIHFTRIAAKEWAKHNIRVNCIAPGVVKTKMSHLMWEDTDWLRETQKNIPLGRLAEPEELAGAALYLASDASSYTTGAILLVDGGNMVV